MMSGLVFGKHLKEITKFVKRREIMGIVTTMITQGIKVICV